MKKFKLFTMFFAALMLLNSCATIMSGSRQNVTFNSLPDAATIYLKTSKGQELSIGKTPLTVPIKRKTEFVIYKKEGFKDTLVYAQNNKIKIRIVDPMTGSTTKQKKIIAKYHVKFNAWYIGNIPLCVLFGITGLVGITVDLIDGASKRLDNQMYIELQKK